MPKDQRQDIVFVDAGIADHSHLVEQLPAGSTVALIDRAGDGLRQMAEHLAGRNGLSAIHLLSHGGEGYIQLAGERVDAERIVQDGDLLAAIGRSLAPDGDILVYGCNVSARDKRFAAALEAATGAGVATSTTPTGSAALGGRWALEGVDGRHRPDALRLDGYRGVLITLSPTYSSANGYVDETFVTVVYDAALDGANPPDKSAFSLQVNGTGVTVASVSVNGTAKTVTITIASYILTAGDIVEINYTDPTGGNDASAIQSPSGDDAVSISKTIIISSTRPNPTFVSAAVDGSTLVMTYDQALDATNRPTGTDFTVMVAGVPVSVTNVAVDGPNKTVTLTLATPVTGGQAVTVAYADPTGGNDANAIQNGSGEDAASLTATAVTNNTPQPPAYVSAKVNGASLVLTYDAALDGANPPDGSDFTVLVDGQPVTATGVVVDGAGKTVTLTLATPVVRGQSVTVAYADPTGGNDANAIQSGAGLDAASLATTAVANRTPQDPNFFLVATNAFGLTNPASPYATSPTFVDIDADGLLDAVIGDGAGGTSVFLNIGTSATPSFSLAGSNFGLSNVGGFAAPAFADLDGDGDLDALVGGSGGATYYFRNMGTSTGPSFSLVGSNQSGLGPLSGFYAAPTLGDIDGDGDIDAIFGDGDGNLRIYRNVGTTAVPSFSLMGTNILGLSDVGSRAKPTLIDVDGDGDLDLLVSNADAELTFFRNVGTEAAPSFSLAGSNPFGLFVDSGLNESAAFADIDGDGDIDAFVGTTFFINGLASPRGLALDAGSDTGVQDGRYTSLTTPTITGTAMAGATVTLYGSDGSTALGSAVADGNGGWSITSGSLAAGDHTLTARVTDVTGTSDASAALTLTIDISAPATPDAPTLEADSDTGAKDGRYTNDTTPTITGTAEANSIVTVYEDGTAVGTAVVDGSGHWTLTTGSLGAGDHSLTVGATDRAGNTSSASSALTLTIDLTAPSAPDSLLLDPGSDNGDSQSDRVTNDDTPEIKGTAEAGSLVMLYGSDGSSLLGTAYADGSGNWSITSSQLGDGTHSLTARSVDAAGNTSSASSTLTLTIDATAPGEPGGLLLAPASDSGMPDGRYTSDTTPTITGTADAYATITLYEGGTALGTVAADGSGLWSVTVGSYGTVGALGSGDHTLTARASDLAGNTAWSDELVVSIDTSAPATPDAPALEADSDTGAKDGRYTSITTPTIAGTAEANSIITVYEGGTAVGTAVADGSGHWTLTTGSLAAGDHSLTVGAMDRAGNSSSASSALTLTIDLTAPSAPDSLVLDQYSDNGASQSDRVTNDDTPEIKGTAEAGSLVMLYGSDGSSLLGTAYADGSGHWSITSSHLGDGTHSLTARSVDAAGNTSSASSTLTLTIDATAPGEPGGLLLAPASDGGTQDGRYTNDTTPTITGTAEANAIITLYEGGTILGTVAADGSGLWSVTVGSYGTVSALGSGDHTLTARATDLAGNSSSWSDDLVVSIDTAAPQLLSAVVNGDRLVLTYDGPLAGAFDPATSAYTVKVGGGTATVSHVDAQGSTVTLLLASPVTRSQSVTLSYVQPGSSPVQDDAGNLAAALSNRAVTNATPNYRAPTTSPFRLPDVGDNAAPALVDIDGDGLLDAIIGTKDGNTLVFRNTGGSGTPTFSLIATNAFGLADIGDNATPVLADIDGDGDLDAFIGGADGNTRVFINVGTSSAPSFSLLGTNAFGLADIGDNAAPTLADIDGDGDLDAFVGGADGNTRVFINHGTSASPSFSLLGTNSFGLGNVGTEAAPAFLDIDGDGDLDAFIGNGDGNVVFFRNVGSSGSPSFSLSATNPYSLADVGDRAKPVFADLDGDGDPDALIGNATGHALHFLNATPLPPPPPPPPPTSTETVDGVTVGKGTQTNSDGSTSSVVTIPVVTGGRTESVGGNTVADIPLVKGSGGASLLTAQVPTGLGLTMTGSSNVKTAGSSLTDLIREIQAHTEAGSNDQNVLTGGGSGFLGGIPGDTPLLVQTIVPTAAPGTTASTEPLVITGTPTAAGNPYTALVIDTRGLPSGTVIQLQNVEFAAVIGAVRVTGGEGSQNVWGDGEAQYIVLGADDDTLHGGGGDDYVGSHTGNDVLYGDTGADTVTGGEDDDLVYGNQQDDIVYGNQGSDTLYGGQDQDIAFGGQGEDAVYGNRGNDVVYGNKGADTLFGGQADDVLFGGQGDDVLFGNRGDDTMTGGLGADLFAFHGGDGGDLVTDFRFEEGDRLAADGRSWTVSDGADGAIVDFGLGDKVTLANIRADQVSSAWFTAS